MSNAEFDANQALFERIASELLTDAEVSRGTMMGYPCLRLRGVFFACVSRSTARLIVKLPAETVAELIANGKALPFAPNGRTFREWVELSDTDTEHWRALLAQAKLFAA